MDWLNKPIVWIAVGAAVIGLSLLKNVPFEKMWAWLKGLLTPSPKPDVPTPVTPATPPEHPTIQAVRDFISMKSAAAASQPSEETKKAFTAIWAGMEPK